MISLGITAMSAGSKTEPGGYTKKEELEQFSTNDNRNPKELAKTIHQHGYEVIWKDWDRFNFLSEI